MEMQIKWLGCSCSDSQEIYNWAFILAHLSCGMGWEVSDLEYLDFLEEAFSSSLAYVADLPVVYAVLPEFLHDCLFFGPVYADKKSSTCLSRITFHEPEVLNRIFHFDQIFIDREGI